MASTLYVINPNSSPAVTAGLDAAVAPLRTAGGPDIRCLDLPEAPAGIQSQLDIERVTLPLLARTEALVADPHAPAGAFVIACYSDPGVAVLREQLPVPVLGIGEAGLLTALSLGQRVGVVAILAGSIARHLRAHGAMGIGSRIVAERALNLTVPELADAQRTRGRLLAVGRQLRDEDGADVLVLGCAGMAARRAELEDALGLPVVDPTQAATAMALGRMLLGWRAPAALRS